MRTITVTHSGQPVALASPTRVWLAAHIEALPVGHPRKRLVAFMAFYARDVLNGALPGPYDDADAERFARLALINTDVIARHPDATDAQLAELLGVPLDQLHTFLTDDNVGQRPRPCGGRRRRLSPTPPIT